MGIFDTIYWKREEKYDPPIDVVFQSKSIRAEMDTFEVREDGSLWMKEARIDERAFAEFCGETLPEDYEDPPPPEFEPFDFTGQVFFYDGEDLSYTAVFNEGKVIFVKKTEWGEHVVKDRIVELIKWVLERGEYSLSDTDLNDLGEALLLVKSVM